MIDYKYHVKNILNHKKINEILLIKNFCDEINDWKSFINIINLHSKKNDNLKILNKEDIQGGHAIVSGELFIRQLFYIYVNLTDVMLSDLNGADKIFNEFDKEFNSQSYVPTAYISLSKNIDNVEPHSDPFDNFYWQNIGTVEWVSKDKKWIVEPGDLVYIPANLEHGINFFEPRAAIGFSWDLNKVLTSTDI